MNRATALRAVRHARALSMARRRGQALVEFALVLPLLILLLLAIVDLGRGIYLYNTVSNAAREGARVGIVHQSDTAAAARAAQEGTGLGLSSTPTTCLAGNSGICVSFPARVDPTGVQGSTTDALVTVWYRFTPITPVIGNVIGTVTLQSTARLPIERVCTTSGC